MRVAMKRLQVRLPVSLHKKLAKRAGAGGLSLNALIVMILSVEQNGRESATTTGSNDAVTTLPSLRRYWWP